MKLAWKCIEKLWNVHCDVVLITNNWFECFGDIFIGYFITHCLTIAVIKFQNFCLTHAMHSFTRETSKHFQVLEISLLFSTSIETFIYIYIFFFQLYVQYVDKNIQSGIVITCYKSFEPARCRWKIIGPNGWDNRYMTV